MHRAAVRRSLVLACLLAGCGDDTGNTPTTAAPMTTDGTSTAGSTGGTPEVTSTDPTAAPTGTSTGGTTTTDTTTTGATTTTTDGTTTDATTVDATSTTEPVDPGTSTTTGTTGDTDTTTGTDGTSTGEPGCPPGDVGCPCDADMECVPEGTCWGGVCVKNGGNLCPYEFDGQCDEGNGICPPGSDPYDCCATQNNGVCEELSMGGNCPDGTDAFDCGGCEWTNDGVCDEPNLCPPGSDKPDCCATPNNGVCEEVDQGGECPEGTDYDDCGECQWMNDGVCDEPNLCDPGTDGDDCCATAENGVCEEIDQGGDCPDHSDDWDCGYCAWLNDGECDEPLLCPPGSDVADCG